MHARFARACAALIAAVAVSGCDPTGGPGGPPEGGGADAGTDGEVAVDAGGAVDGAVGLDGAPEDAGIVLLDAGGLGEMPSPDAAADDGGCGACAPSSPCVTAACVGFACVETPVTDGLDCGATTICVSGACVARGCGDGWIEPGPDPVAEACDDGNAADGDLCSASCVPTVFALDSAGRDGMPVAQGAAVSADGAGAVAYVWAARGADDYAIFAQRFDSHAAPVGAGPLPVQVSPIELSEATVAGLGGGGFAVVWTEEAARVRACVLGGDGTLGAVVDVATPLGAAATGARVAAQGDGFVVVWRETRALADAEDPGRGLRARRFGRTGIAVSSELFVALDRVGDEEEPEIASVGDTWAVAWTRSAAAPSTEPSEARARRFAGGAPLDATDLVLATGPARSAALARSATGFVATWVEGASLGDVRACALPDGDTPGAAFDVAVDPLVAETLPAVADGAYGWRVAAARRGLAFSFSSTLTDALDRFGPTNVALARTPRGLWISYADGGARLVLIGGAP